MSMIWVEMLFWRLWLRWNEIWKTSIAFFDDLRTPRLDDAIKLIEQMVYEKNTNASVEKHREDSEKSSIEASGLQKRSW